MVIYINSNLYFEKFVKKIFNILEIENFIESHSLNVLDGHYFSSNIFGFKIQIEKNSYDMEEKFNYTLFLNDNFLSKTETNNSLKIALFEIIYKILKENLDCEIEKDI